MSPEIVCFDAYRASAVADAVPIRAATFSLIAQSDQSAESLAGKIKEFGHESILRLFIALRNSDDDGLRLVSAAIGANPAASQPETAMPGLKPPGGWLGRIRAAVGAADNRDVSRLPEPSAETR